MNSIYYYYAKMEFDDVRAFVSVADTGSVSQAAHDLYVTQSAVTRRLQRLETSLGATLLDRRTRPVMLTGAGQAALARCRRLLNEAREVRAAAANGDLPMEMRIGVAHALTELTLTRPVDRVRRKFPKIALRLRTGWSRELLERVQTGALDAAVILLPREERLPSGVIGETMGNEKLVVVASRSTTRGSARRIQDLAGIPWILNPEGCAARAALRRALSRSNIDLVVAVETYNYELQLALAAQKQGLGLVPKRILERSPVRSRLRTLQIPGLDFPLTVWMVHGQLFTKLDPLIAELSRGLIERL